MSELELEVREGVYLARLRVRNEHKNRDKREEGRDIESVLSFGGVSVLLAMLLAFGCTLLATMLVLRVWTSRCYTTCTVLSALSG